MNSYSQLGQDRFVINVLKEKRNGTFLDVGCADYKRISNTYLLESEYDWRGIGVDLVECNKEGWEKNRPNSVFLLEDATKLDYEKVLKDNGFDLNIDYLSIDLEPPAVTLNALYRVFEFDLKFKVITFEHDSHRDPNVQSEARTFLSYQGYRLVNTVMQDDYFVSEDVFKSLSL